MAQVDYFLKIDGVEGESTDSKHAKEIELESWSFGGTNAGSFSSGGGGGTGKVALGDFNFVKKTDKSSAKLLTACCTGEHITKGATLVCRKAGKDQQEFLTIVLSPVIVSSYQTGGSAGSDVIPMDQVSLNFGKVEYKYKEQKPDGSLGGEIVGGWDVTTNKPV